MKSFFKNSLFWVKRFVTLDVFQSKDYGHSDVIIWDRFVAPNIILNCDGSLMTIMRFRGNDHDSSTDDECAFMSQYVNLAMCKMGSGWAVHVDCVRKESVGYIRESDCNFTSATHYLIDQERRFGYNQEGMHYENDYYLSFTWLPPADTISKLQMVFVNEGETQPKNTVNYSKYLTLFKEQVSDVVDILSRKFTISRISDDEIFSYLHYTVSGNWLNLKLKNNYWTPIRYQVTNQDYINSTSPMIGEKHLRVISFGEEFPNATYPTMLRELNNLGFSYRWVTRYIFLDKLEAEKYISKMADLHYQGRKSAASLAIEHFGGNNDHKINRSADVMFDDAEEARMLSEVGGIRFGKYTCSLVLYEDDVTILNEKVKIIKSVINNLNFLARVESTNAMEAYLGTLPGMVRANVRKYVMHSTNLADLLPTTAVWAGQTQNHCRYYKEAGNNPVLFYASTTGNTPFRVSLHVNDIGHTLILGPSRTGKSVLLNFMASQHTRYKNAKVYIFDNGLSSLPLCYATNGGIHYDIGADDTNISFKPLEHLNTDEDFSFACEWLADLCTVQGFEIKAKHRTMIAETLAIIRDVGADNQRTLSYFYYQISSRDDSDRDFSEQFKPYTKTGGAGMQSIIFDAVNDSLTLSRFTVFELAKLTKAGDQILIPAIRYLFHMIERGLDGSPTMIVIDEAATPFKHPVFCNILDDWLRKIAKKNVNLVMATQQLNDIMKTDIFDVLTDNCKTSFLLANESAEKEYIRELYTKFGLNEKQIELVANAIAQREYYYMSSLGNRMFRLDLGDIAMAYLGRTSLEDIKMAKELKKEHPDDFGGYWLKYVGLPSLQNIWNNVNSDLLEKTDERQI